MTKVYKSEGTHTHTQLVPGQNISHQFQCHMPHPCETPDFESLFEQLCFERVCIENSGCVKSSNVVD